MKELTKALHTYNLRKKQVILWSHTVLWKHIATEIISKLYKFILIITQHRPTISHSNILGYFILLRNLAPRLRAVILLILKLQ